MTDLPSIGRPARNALNAIGITTLEGALALGDDGLLAVHGVGPKAVLLLREAAAASTTKKKTKKTKKKKTAKKKKTTAR